MQRAVLVTPNSATYPGLLASSPPIHPRQLSPIRCSEAYFSKSSRQLSNTSHYDLLNCLTAIHNLNTRSRRLHTSSTMVVRELTSFANMGRGAYDTTGVPKPPPRPKPR
nr:uncharacterized protein CTRU02_13593 [Colletotrichum truncatum]KAF6783126.1 hypothetical protein CTRU02_13593 [Colletotrichum truncatum]